MWLVAICVFIILGLSGGLLNVAWTYMRVTFGVPFELLGLLLLCGTVGSLTAAFANGTVVRWWGIGLVITLGAILAGGGMLAIASSPSWAVLLIAIFVMYLGRGTLDAGLNSFVSENYDSWAMNLLHASWGLGLTFSAGLMSFILLQSENNWRLGYIIIGVVYAVLLGMILWHFSDWQSPDSQSDAAEGPTVERFTAQATLHQPIVWWSLLLLFIYGGMEIGTGQLINTLLVESREVSQGTAGLLLSIYWGSFTVGRLLVGVAALRLSDQQILSVCVPAIVVGAVGLLVRDSVVVTFVALTICGLGLAPIFPILISQTPKRVGVGHSANTIGFQVGAGGLGAAILPGILGRLTGVFGLEFIGVGLLINALVLLVLYQWVVRRYPLVQTKAKRMA